jgi:hypothetical protein
VLVLSLITLIGMLVIGDDVSGPTFRDIKFYFITDTLTVYAKHVSVTKINWFVLCNEITPVYFENLMKPTNTLWAK